MYVNCLYLAGPMTGIPKFNFPAFMAAREDLTKHGYKIVSPADMDVEEFGGKHFESETGQLGSDGTGMSFGDFLSRDVKLVCDEVEGVVCLPGWNNTMTARIK